MKAESVAHAFKFGPSITGSRKIVIEICATPCPTSSNLYPVADYQMISTSVSNVARSHIPPRATIHAPFSFQFAFFKITGWN
jgi:hypothetical protein